MFTQVNSSWMVKSTTEGTEEKSRIDTRRGRGWVRRSVWSYYVNGMTSHYETETGGCQYSVPGTFRETITLDVHKSRNIGTLNLVVNRVSSTYYLLPWTRDIVNPYSNRRSLSYGPTLIKGVFIVSLNKGCLLFQRPSFINDHNRIYK